MNTQEGLKEYSKIVDVDIINSFDIEFKKIYKVLINKMRHKSAKESLYVAMILESLVKDNNHFSEIKRVMNHLKDRVNSEAWIEDYNTRLIIHLEDYIFYPNKYSPEIDVIPEVINRVSDAFINKTVLDSEVVTRVGDSRVISNKDNLIKYIRKINRLIIKKDILIKEATVELELQKYKTSLEEILIQIQ